MDTACLSRKLEQLTRAAAIPGVQLAVHHDQETWTCELGEEEGGKGRLFTKDSKVPIGSISKTFTAALAMVLVSDGDLDLDTPVAGYLPELRQAAGELGDRLTLRHLLSHTGGLPSDPDQVRATTMRRHVLDCLRRLPPLHGPGRAFSYSNLGYVLAGHLIEATTGMTWWEAMESVLLKPLGLDPAFVVGPGPRPTATGHSVNPALGRVRPVHQSLAAVDAPAGAVAASASDLVTLGRVLAGTDGSALIDPAVLREMHTPVPGAEPFGVADGWGLGLAIYHDAGRTWIGHDGTGDGTSAHLRIDPAGGTVVAMTTNASTGFPTWHRFVHDVRQDGLPIGDYRGVRDIDRRELPAAECATCIGSYHNGELEYTVHDDGGRLHLTMDGEPFAELTLYAGFVFAMRDVQTGETDMTGRFIQDSHDGDIGWIQVGGRLARRSERVCEVA